MMNPLRAALQQASLASLRNIKYDNYQAIILGDEDKIEHNLHFVKAPEGSKGDRLAFALNYLKTSNTQFDYICRFDDDDIFNPFILNNYAQTNADCIADLYHAFYNLASHQCIVSKKTWLANTVFLKKAHALSVLKDGRTLIEQDHAEEWMPYFADKKITYSHKNHPLYLRVLSPTSITANIDKNAYKTYLQSFGNWKKHLDLNDFVASLINLYEINQAFYKDYSVEKGAKRKTILEKLFIFLNLTKP